MSKLLTLAKKNLGGFEVTRILPNADQPMVGPFIFMDHMGPASFEAGDGIDVRPHPHIGLSTLTYMFEGQLLHRDSLGNHVEINPGDVNWMTAGSGIVHSERETIEVKASKHVLSGLQCWLALPKEKAEISPSFQHIKKQDLPHQMKDNVVTRVIAGDAYGMSSPINTHSPLFYVDIVAQQDKSIERPNPSHECLLYIVYGDVAVNSHKFTAGNAIILDSQSDIQTLSNTRIVMLGGQAWSEKPLIEWNFVSFEPERIKQAKDDWQHGRFPSIAGDNEESTPLPSP